MYAYHFLPFLATQCTRPFYRMRDHIMSLLRPRASSFISQFLSPGPAFYIDYFFLSYNGHVPLALCVYTNLASNRHFRGNSSLSFRRSYAFFINLPYLATHGF